jgi:hypothetical protein
MYRNIKLENKIRQILKNDGELFVDERPNHKRLNMSACNDGDEYNISIWNNNKEVCSLFKNHFAYVSFVVCCWKGTIYGYIVPKYNFEDWWLVKNQYEGIGADGVNGLYHLYSDEYSGFGTCDILTDLYHNCRWFENEMNKVEKKHKKYLEKERKKEETERYRC